MTIFMIITALILMIYIIFRIILRNDLSKARKYATKGYASEMKAALHNAKNVAGLMWKNIFKQVAEIEKEGYTNAITFRLKQARDYADQGDLRMTECNLNCAKDNAIKVCKDVPEEVSKIEQLCYRNALENARDKALELAKESCTSWVMREFNPVKEHVANVEKQLNLAREYAAKLGEEISKQLAHTQGLCYMNALEAMLSIGKKYAENGVFSMMNESLNCARKYAAKVGRDICERVVEIEQLCYTKAVPLQLDKARFWAVGNDPLRMENSLSLASLYSSKIGMDITNEVGMIRALLV